VHFTHNLLTHSGRQGRRVVAALLHTAFVQESPESASAKWRQIAGQLRPKLPKLATVMDEAEHDVLACMTFPREHYTQLHPTNPLERHDGEIKLRTDVVCIFSSAGGSDPGRTERRVGSIAGQAHDSGYAAGRRR
jgi:transposase-like protein